MRSALLTLACMGLVVCACGCGRPSAADQLARGQQLEAEGQYADALAAYEAAAATDPAAAEPHWAMAQVYRRWQRYTEAQQALRAYLAAAPHGQHAAAAQRQLAALADQPTTPPRPAAAPVAPPAKPPPARDARREWATGQLGLAQDLERQGRYLEARRAFGAVLTVDPDFEGAAEVYEHMAWCSLGLEPPQRTHAAAYLRAAAKVYRQHNRPDEAQRCLIMAEEHDRAGAEAAAAEAPPPPGPPPPPLLPEPQPTGDTAGEGEP